jgi:hypothetical protein
MRVLKQPVTLFGETDEQRLLRLAIAERDVQASPAAHLPPGQHVSPPSAAACAPGAPPTLAANARCCP